MKKVENIFLGKKILIYGLGKTGISAYKFLKNKAKVYLFDDKIRNFIVKNVTADSVYKLFPYSSSKYDPEKALIEIKESSNNLNTRLSNLKKINKSLNTFEEDSSSLNWEELQNISNELEDDYKDN